MSSKARPSGLITLSAGNLLGRVEVGNHIGAVLLLFEARESHVCEQETVELGDVRRSNMRSQDRMVRLLTGSLDIFLRVGKIIEHSLVCPVVE